MQEEKDKARRASIAYILRRRKRGGKTRSNSGEPVKSWAEYGEVNFTPTGSTSPTWIRWLLLPLGLLFCALPLIIIGAARGYDDLDPANVSFVTYGLVAITGFLIIAILIFSLLFLALNIWRFIRSTLFS